MKGYWKKPQETADVLKNGRLHTGDIAIMDARGYVYIVDRLKDMIITNGYNVYPRNVEEAIKSLAPGQASGPHQEGRTLWLVQLIERVEQRPLSFEEARPRLRAALIARRREEIRNDLRAEILKAQEIEVRP